MPSQTALYWSLRPGSLREAREAHLAARSGFPRSKLWLLSSFEVCLCFAPAFLIRHSFSTALFLKIGFFGARQTWVGSSSPV